MKYTRGDMSTNLGNKVRFSDIAGMREAKVEIKEYVEYLKHPARFQVNHYTNYAQSLVSVVL